MLILCNWHSSRRWNDLEKFTLYNYYYNNEVLYCIPLYLICFASEDNLISDNNDNDDNDVIRFHHNLKFSSKQQKKNIKIKDDHHLFAW